MKIAIDARTLGSRPSGIGMYLNDFLKQMVKYEEFEFVLLSDVKESEYIKNFENQGIKVITQGKAVYKSAGVYSYFDFIQKQLDEIKPDIFWEVNTIIPKKLKGDFKIMITIHDMFPITHAEYFGFVYSTYFRHNLKKTLKQADLVLYNSEQTKKTTEKEFLIAKYKKNCNAYIIANPLVNEYTNTDEDFLLYVGNMEKRKGVDLLLDGYLRYVSLGGKKKLVLAGKMQEEDIRAKLNAAMGKCSSIEYKDYVSHEMKHQLFSKCSCFVFPSKAEGFGMPVIEVMKFRKPILVSNLEIYDELIGDCINRFEIHCEKNKQVENLAQAMLDYNACVDGEKYKETVEKFSPQHLGEILKRFIMENVNESV